jgi:hypothetical protein
MCTKSDGLRTNTCEGDDGSTAALDSELREGLDVESFVEGGSSEDLRGDDGSLAASPVDPNLDHRSFLVHTLDPSQGIRHAREAFSCVVRWFPSIKRRCRGARAGCVEGVRLRRGDPQDAPSSALY